MDPKNPEQPPQQVCTFNIMFPVNSDEQAIEIKQKLGAVLSEISEARIDFSLRTMPTRPPRP